MENVSSKADRGFFGGWGKALFVRGKRKARAGNEVDLFISTRLLVRWLAVVLVFDHLSFWRIRPGQLTHEYVLGAFPAPSTWRLCSAKRLA